MKIAFYKGSSWIDKCILFFSRGGYSHCGFLFDDGTTIDAFPFVGVEKRWHLTQGIPHGNLIDVYEVETTPSEDAIIKEFAIRQIGKGYDYIALIGFIIYASAEGRKKYGRWICSEIVFAAFRKAGVNLLERVDAWKVSPTMLSYNTRMKLVESIKI